MDASALLTQTFAVRPPPSNSSSRAFSRDPERFHHRPRPFLRTPAVLFFRLFGRRRLRGNGRRRRPRQGKRLQTQRRATIDHRLSRPRVVIPEHHTLLRRERPERRASPPVPNVPVLDVPVPSRMSPSPSRPRLPRTRARARPTPRSPPPRARVTPRAFPSDARPAPSYP